jgi:hypothetical protein
MEATIMTTGQSRHTVFGLALAQALLAAAAVAATANAQEAAPKELAKADYVAHLSALNTKTAGGAASGEARFTIKGDSLTISVDASGLPGGITHWQHFHGFPNGRSSACPTTASDANHDGIIDITETAPKAGTTMVPFSSDPVSMDVPHGDYPKASAAGTLRYEETVSLSALQKAFGNAFDGQRLDLDRRVVFIHGVPAAAKLPASVASLGPIPAQVTLPIACGLITRVK